MGKEKTDRALCGNFGLSPRGCKLGSEHCFPEHASHKELNKIYGLCCQAMQGHTLDSFKPSNPSSNGDFEDGARMKAREDY